LTKLAYDYNQNMSYETGGTMFGSWADHQQKMMFFYNRLHNRREEIRDANPNMPEGTVYVKAWRQEMRLERNDTPDSVFPR